LIKSCSLRPGVNAFVEKTGEEAKVKLSDLLRIPVQRIFKYQLLLKELKTRTEVADPECSVVQDALTAMEIFNLLTEI